MPLLSPGAGEPQAVSQVLPQQRACRTQGPGEDLGEEDAQGLSATPDGAAPAAAGEVDDSKPPAWPWDAAKGRCVTSWLFFSLRVDTGSKFPPALLARNAPPHAARAGLLHGGEHRRRVRLHPLQSYLRRADAHRAAGAT